MPNRAAVPSAGANPRGRADRYLRRRRALLVRLRASAEASLRPPRARLSIPSPTARGDRRRGHPTRPGARYVPRLSGGPTLTRSVAPPPPWARPRPRPRHRHPGLCFHPSPSAAEARAPRTSPR